MNTLSTILLIAVVIAAAFAVWSILRRGAKCPYGGNCAGCDACRQAKCSKKGSTKK